MAATNHPDNSKKSKLCACTQLHAQLLKKPLLGHSPRSIA